MKQREARKLQRLQKKGVDISKQYSKGADE